MNFDEIREKLIMSAQADLPTHLARLDWSKAELETFQLKRLRALLKTAQANTTWYKDALKNRNLDEFAVADLKSLPI